MNDRVTKKDVLALLAKPSSRAGEKYRRYATGKANELLDEAGRHFKKQQIPGNDRTSPTTPIRYVDGFFVDLEQDNLTFTAGNADKGAGLVEFGGYAGGDKNAYVLGYFPLTLAAEVLSNRAADQDINEPDFIQESSEGRMKVRSRDMTAQWEPFSPENRATGSTFPDGGLGDE